MHYNLAENMNLQCTPVPPPLRVLVVNALSCASQLTITKIMSGLVFGAEQLIDLILLVCANEQVAARNLELELYNCGFCTLNTIKISTDFPLITDADIFCFITNFRNPNSVDFYDIHDREFDVLYLIIKIANNLCKPKPDVQDKEKKEDNIFEKKYVENKNTFKPIIMADGVVTMNILKHLAKDLPFDIFFCPTPLTTLGKKVLGDELKIPAGSINNMLVWGANNTVFHIEVAKPIVIGSKVVTETHCDWHMIGRNVIREAGLDTEQLNESWLKKDFIQKVLALASKNPYGSISRAAEFAKTLNIVWKTRAFNAVEGSKVYASVGVISDGSFDTMKGFAYVLPLVFLGDTWSIDKCYSESFHVKQEIQRINKTVQSLKEKLLPYCKRFLEENVKDLSVHTNIRF